MQEAGVYLTLETAEFDELYGELSGAARSSSARSRRITTGSGTLDWPTPTAC